MTLRFALTIIRHGETRYNKEKLLQGQGVDEPLSEMGFKQAEAAGQFLQHVKFTHVFSSDLQRAKQTAAVILANNWHKDLEIIYDTRLRERKYGVAEGNPLSQLRAMAKAAGTQCPSFTPPGGETLEQVRNRIKDFFQYVCQLIMDQYSQQSHPRQVQRATASNGFQTVSDTFSVQKSHLDDSNISSVTQDSDVDLVAQVLVVSHGAYMRTWIKYLVDELHCTFSPDLTKSQIFSGSPNTGISNFIVSLEAENCKPDINCIYINKHEHLETVNIAIDFSPQQGALDI
ncbi:fructose-2,6-bisphosphatase TIGAR isoform X2 [Protopterus annectens]|uniref:fructose-2,6-bisphosphatase TIGAR isoform X2 n=1 Tax=Protopterus annectens TaxID=7888 RepID=UPI001CFAE044|nr:fructose-2,6-bisphosphatase TIGAR isoform X2 [Protopterus annectens]